MLCSACQEQEGNIDLGCLHLYCEACLDNLGGKCRDGCTPTPQMPIEDARRIFQDLEKRLSEYELLVSKKIAKAEKKVRDLISMHRTMADSLSARAKKAEYDLETLLIRSQLRLEKRFAVRNYAKVHFESDCVPDHSRKRFRLSDYLMRSTDGPAWRIEMSLSTLVPHVRLPVDVMDVIGQYGCIALDLIAKSRKMLLLRIPKSHISLVVDLETNDVEVVRTIFPEASLLFFRGKELTFCPIPEGFKYAINNIAIRPHNDPDKFEIFDPAVGKLELAVADKTGCRPQYLNEQSLDADYHSRTRIVLTYTQFMSIPYLD